MKKTTQPTIVQLHGTNAFTYLMREFQQLKMMRIDGHYYDKETESGHFLATINKNIAEELLHLNTPDNRLLPRNNLLFLLEEMNENNWIFNGDTIRFTRTGNLADAQTRLHAFIKSNLTSIRLSFVYNLSKEALGTMDRGKRRNPVDYFAMYGVKVNTASVLRVVKAIYWASIGQLYNLNNRMESLKKLRDCYEAHKEEIVNIAARASATYKDYKRLSITSPVLTASEFERFYGLLAACTNEDKAARYMTALTFNLNMDFTHPAATVRRMLVVENSRANKFERRKLSEKATTTYVLRGWFAFLSNTGLTDEQANSMNTLPTLVPFPLG